MWLATSYGWPLSDGLASTWGDSRNALSRHIFKTSLFIYYFGGLVVMVMWFERGPLGYFLLEFTAF